MEGNLFDYLEWRGDITFAQVGVNTVDALIFSTLTYINYPVGEGEEVTLKEAAARWSELPEEQKYRGLTLMKTDCTRLAETVTRCRRFRDVRVTCYEEISHEDTEEQFSAMSFLLPGKTVFEAFRGTDNTLIGWKEDFNMAFTSGTPAQKEAEVYAQRVAERYPERTLQLGGHSKGGNLAVWAAVHLPDSVQKRVRVVYNNDGPGFIDHLTQSPAYLSISDRILSFVPESSVIGVLMGNCEYLTVSSTGVSLLQHDPFSWKVVGNHFVYETERSRSGKVIAHRMNEMIRTMPPDELSAFVEDVFHELRSDEAKTLTDLRKHLFRHLFRTLSRIQRFRARENEARRKELREAISKL